MSNSEQFCLRWNNHQSTLVSVFENLLDSNVLIDCTLCAEGKFLKAHRVVLSACSPIFKDMMAIQEDKHPIVFLNDVSFLEMRAMLDYMYKGEVNILQDQLDSFLRTAAALQIKGLTDQGGGGTDEPPAKKGPGRKTGMSDAPESPLVGNAPLREGSMSPTRRRRRVPRRPDSADDQSAENSCDIPSAPQTGSLAPAPSSQSALSSANQSSLSAADLMHHGPASSTPNSASRLPPVRKHEPIDQTQVVKQEYVEEPQEDIEDLTLDDDEDYNDNMSTVSDMAKPGTSFHHSQSNQGDFGVDWNPIMANQSGTDDVFLRATEAINNQSTTQEFLAPQPVGIKLVEQLRNKLSQACNDPEEPSPSVSTRDKAEGSKILQNCPSLVKDPDKSSQGNAKSSSSPVLINCVCKKKFSKSLIKMHLQICETWKLVKKEKNLTTSDSTRDSSSSEEEDEEEETTTQPLSLKTHERTKNTPSCSKPAEETTTARRYICECDARFTTSNVYKIHLKTCSKRSNPEIEEVQPFQRENLMMSLDPLVQGEVLADRTCECGFRIESMSQYRQHSTSCRNVSKPVENYPKDALTLAESSSELSSAKLKLVSQEKIRKAKAPRTRRGRSQSSDDDDESRINLRSSKPKPAKKQKAA